MSAALLGELTALYRDSDALYAHHGCSACARCCHGRLAGREPYVTSIELCAIARAVRRRGGALARAPRRGKQRPVAVDDGTCPLLAADGRCKIYQDRPLGCRTFWCHRADRLAQVPHRRLLELVNRLRDLAERHEPGGAQGRPLPSALRDLATAR